ncbi:c-type cytochrome [Vannielia litorea]|uniref:c-type cytochrome n=1 Tax=Vannielia litorea TaxID=1217970 RepID=UPI001C982AE0|nr:c-type cytochrome [Vannielia litorea]MBY6155353.1 c-type cytochrome [Vannielia litorea]
MRTPITALALAALLAGPALAESHEAEAGAETETEAMAEMAAPTGDAAAGEETFAKRCVTCHVVQDADGNTLAGKASKTGPNLYNVAGHTAGAVEGFRYSKDLEAAGAESGLVWTEEHFVAYVQDPRGFLREFTGDSKAKSKMSFRLKGEEDAANVYAYLVSLNSM